MIKFDIDPALFPKVIEAVAALKKSEPINGFQITENEINSIKSLRIRLHGNNVALVMSIAGPNKDFRKGSITLGVRVYVPKKEHATKDFIYLFDNSFQEFPEIISPSTIQNAYGFTNMGSPTMQLKIKRIFKKTEKDLNAAYLTVVKVIQQGFTAQSKEDFYDDASDYQDDEPTDFGDASNYDEGLVRRIKEILE